MMVANKNVVNREKSTPFGDPARLGVPSPRAPRKKSNWLSKWQAPYAGYLFISPWLIGFLLLVLWPIIQSFYLSFTNYTLLAPPDWVGINNYSRIFTTDDTFRDSLKVTLVFVFLSVPLKLAFALFIALLLNRNIRGLSVYSTLVYFPSLIGTSVAVAILWKNMFNRDGIVNQILGLFGFPPYSWITELNTALFTLVLLVVWQYGSSMIIFLAGLKQIPQDLYEAASVDGANKVVQFFRITLPMLSPVILFNFTMQTIIGFQMFTQAFIITEGGPIRATYVYALYLYDKAFANFQMGYASALAWIMLIITALITGLIFASSRYWVFYQSDAGSK